MNVKKVTAWVVLGVYVLVLLSLLRPGGVGQDSVQAFGEGLAGLLPAVAAT